MIVNQAGCLHEGIANCGADEAEALASKLFAEKFSLGSLGGYLRIQPPGVLLGMRSQQRQQVMVETPELPLEAEKGLGIGDGGPYLLSIADNAGILE